MKPSGGYVTPNSEVRNGRVFNVKLSDIRREYPSVETWNSCSSTFRSSVTKLTRVA